ncbi:peptidoglycan DD-metalloendopeptidase family protein [uncultured Paraglaciecola sp.]|uniref:murein hydrolase activator EnvC family protein n=1 Tax=uncultured Paraglaciecola sp. TaxID=1765024 RepID=UPI002593D8AA|nr:peptidoglycan DD-metalloendopeptidase family protein [uncultured Paraglaciecola sp.]
MFLLLATTPQLLAQEKSDLELIQKQIEDKKKQIAKQLNEAKKLQENLKKIELNVAQTAKSLNHTDNQIANNQKEQAKLLKQQEEYQDALNQQKSELAKQIRSAYMTGNYDFAKMLLNQEDAANFERSITYYQYLNKARKEQIDSFNVLVKELKLVREKLIEGQSELERLKYQQVSEQNVLKKQLASRQVTMTKLQASIESDEAKIAQLQVNEKNLTEALARAQQRVAQQSVSLNGLSKQKGSLLIPAKGTLRKMFGRFRQGQIKWKGIVIYGNSGDDVIAIHDGKVLYADWLRGFGLVTVLDHGDGFMSLYGHNQALLKQVGDSVTAGESVALLGQSGGQSRPNLYFEIRHKGKPVNPVSWLKL